MLLSRAVANIRMLQPRWRRLVLGVVCNTASRVLAVGLAALCALFVSQLSRRSNERGLFTILAIALAAVLAQTFLSRWATLLVASEGQRVISTLRDRLIRQILHRPLSFFDFRTSSSLAAQLMADSESVRTLFQTALIEAAGSLTMATVAFILIAVIDLPAALGMLLVLAGLACGVYQILGNLRTTYAGRSMRFADLSGRLGEAFGGIRLIKVLGAEEREAQILSGYIGTLDERERTFIRFTSHLGAISAGAVGLSTLVIMGFGGESVLHGRVTAGAFLLCFLLLPYAVLPIVQALSGGAQTASSLAAIERLVPYLLPSPQAAVQSNGVVLEAPRGEIVIDEVSFSYQPQQYALREVSFRAEPGSITAIVGPSGAGKSTLVNLICGVIMPTYGSILVDGVDMRHLDVNSYRTRIGVVLQETFLFAGTIYDNVAYARPGATSAQVFDACEKANLMEVIAQLPQGFQTPVGERGVTLSGGQRQRLAIARALLIDPSILILDEAAANLDVESEAYLRGTWAHLRPSRTVFIVTHKLSSIVDADQIIVLNHGRIAEIGDHRSLVERRGFYHRYFSLQGSEMPVPA